MDPLHELRDLAERHVRPGQFATAHRHDLGLQLVVARPGVGGAVDPVLGHPFGFVVQGEARVALGHRDVTCAAGSYFVAGIDRPVAVRVPRAASSETFVAVTIAVKPGCVMPLLDDARLAVDDGDDTGLDVSVAADDVLNPLVRLVRLLDQPRDVKVLAPLVARELLWRLLHRGVGSRLRQIARVDPRHAQVDRAARWIRDHYRDTVRIGELARLAGMSATSFHRHFRAATKMTPLQYQKQLRLQAARVALLAGGDDVVRIGHAVGYESATQFSREYRRMYGGPPGQTRPRRSP